VSQFNKVPDLPNTSPYSLSPELPFSGTLSLLRLHIAVNPGTGILTRFPSATHFCLTLGADSPCVDYRCAGNLGLSACRVFTCIIVTHVSIRTSDTSSKLFSSPSTAYRTLLYHTYKYKYLYASAASVSSFSPVTSSAQTDLTSELLRFL
jgi:hypothetical protein